VTNYFVISVIPGRTRNYTLNYLKITSAFCVLQKDLFGEGQVTIVFV